MQILDGNLLVIFMKKGGATFYLAKVWLNFSTKVAPPFFIFSLSFPRWHHPVIQHGNFLVIFHEKRWRHLLFSQILAKF
jgi:hypothetical protein